VCGASLPVSCCCPRDFETPRFACNRDVMSSLFCCRFLLLATTINRLSPCPPLVALVVVRSRCMCASVGSYIAPVCARPSNTTKRFDFLIFQFPMDSLLFRFFESWGESERLCTGTWEAPASPNDRRSARTPGHFLAHSGSFRDLKSVDCDVVSMTSCLGHFERSRSI